MFSGLYTLTLCLFYRLRIWALRFWRRKKELWPKKKLLSSINNIKNQSTLNNWLNSCQGIIITTAINDVINQLQHHCWICHDVILIFNTITLMESYLCSSSRYFLIPKSPSLDMISEPKVNKGNCQFRMAFSTLNGYLNIFSTLTEQQHTVVATVKITCSCSITSMTPFCVICISL